MNGKRCVHSSTAKMRKGTFCVADEKIVDRPTITSRGAAGCLPRFKHYDIEIRIGFEDIVRYACSGNPRSDYDDFGLLR